MDSHNRRGFFGRLGALLAAPIVARFVPPTPKVVVRHQPMVGGAYLPDAEFNISKRRTYYLSTDGSDRFGDGTRDHPWRNLSKALGQAKPRDTIMIRGQRRNNRG